MARRPIDLVALEEQEQVKKKDGTYKENTGFMVTRVRNLTKTHRWRLTGSLWCLIFACVVILALEQQFGSMTEFKLFVIALLVLWIVVYSRYLIPFRVPITCFSCRRQVNLNQPWVCGYCADEKDPALMQTYVRYKVPLEECAACGGSATSIECPHCEEPIVFDVDEYNNQESAGTLKFGMARFL